MSVSRHPVALRLERRVGGATRLLATVMALPLIDGIFPALVIAGALATPAGVVETGVLIFGGSATMAVILAEMDAEPREAAVSVLAIGVVLVPLAAAEAALAATLDSLLDLEIFTRFAGLVILAVAAKTASAKVGDYLPGPGVIVTLGLVGSLRPAGATFQLANDPAIVARGAAAAAVGVAFALGVALAGPQLRGRVDIDRFRFGSAVALGVLALPILGVLETDAPIALATLGVAGLLSYDPDGAPGPDTDTEADTDTDAAGSDPSAAVPRAGDDPGDQDGPGGMSEEGVTAADDPGDDREDHGDPSEPVEPFSSDDSRAPWL